MSLAEDLADQGIGRVFKCCTVIKCSDDLSLHLNDFLLLDHALAPGDHRRNLRRINFVHFTGDEEQSDSHLLVILRGKVDGSTLEVIEIGNSKVLGVLGNLLVVGKDPLDGQLPVMIVIAVQGI